MATEMGKNGYRVWGYAKSWIVTLYCDGKAVWDSEWLTSKEEADKLKANLERKGSS